MSMNITQFKSTINQGGVAKASHFEVTVSRGNTSGSQDLTMRIDSVEFPSRSLASTEFTTYGPIQKIAYGSIYEDVSITVLLSKDFNEKIFFEEWQDLAIGTARTEENNTTQNSLFDVGYYDNYKGTVVIKQFDVDGTETYNCELIEAYPISVNALIGNWNSEELHRLTVRFAYRHFKDKRMNDGTA